MRINLRATLLLLAALPAPLHAQQHFPSNNDLRDLRGISDPQLSPDLKHVVVVVQDSTAEGAKSHLWLLSTDGSDSRQLTFNRPEGMGERTPEYLPDGSAILYVSRGLYRLPLDGGEAVAISLERPPAPGSAPAAVNIDSYTISPDGRTVAVIGTDPQLPTHARDLREKRDVEWVEHNELEHRLYLLDSKTWKQTEVPTLINVDSVSWSQSSDRLLVLTHTRLRDLGPSTAAWIVSPQNPSEQKQVQGFPESARHPVWMHNGNGLVLFSKCVKDAPEGCSDLYTFDLASGKLNNLTASTIGDSTLSPGTLIVSADDRTALVGISHGMKDTIAQVDLSTGGIRMLDFGLPVVTDFRPQGGDKAYVYMGSSSTSPSSVYMTTSLDRPGTRLVQPETVPADWKAAPSKLITWKRAGFTIEGLLYLPPQASAGPVPLVVNVHGGPTGRFADSYSTLTNLLVGQGWAVLVMNPRGSTGYGVDFEAANKNDMGNGDFLDLMAGVDTVIRAEPIDEKRMALIGYSYGGEMAGFVEGKTSRFKAIVSGAPVIDQFSEYGTESGSYGDRWFTGQPWLHFESAWRQSPLSYAGNAKTPLLLLQGESDTTDPDGQSKEMYRALRQEGVPVQLLLFPRENHGALGGNFSGHPSPEPWAGVIARQHMIEFISDAFAGKVEPNKP